MKLRRQLAFAREWRRTWQVSEQRWLLIWLPLLLGILVTAIFYEGKLKELPIAVVAQGEGALQRQLLRDFQSVPSVSLIRMESLEAAETSMRRNEVYAIIHLPRELDRSINRREAASVHLFLNSQLLLVGNTLETDIQQVVQKRSAELQIRHELAQGRPMKLATSRIQPIDTQRTALSNPGLDFTPFLAGTAVPCVLQITLLLGSIWVVGYELRQATARRWWKLSGQSRFLALSSKLTPIIIFGCLWGWIWLGWLFSPGLPGLLPGFDWPTESSLLWLGAAWFLFVLATVGLGAGMALLTANLRLGLSLGAFLSAPAMAFAGITFPHFAMPLPAVYWAQLIPVNHFLKLQEFIVYKGSYPSTAVAALTITALLGWLTAISLVSSRCQNPKNWMKS
ncbi:MAG: ABC transporter permease [Opitutales bacterium]|nr:ABC transporter permease [Opitutales bacterium]